MAGTTVHSTPLGVKKNLGVQQFIVPLVLKKKLRPYNHSADSQCVCGSQHPRVTLDSTIANFLASAWQEDVQARTTIQKTIEFLENACTTDFKIIITQ